MVRAGCVYTASHARYVGANALGMYAQRAFGHLFAMVALSLSHATHICNVATYETRQWHEMKVRKYPHNLVFVGNHYF